jgi:cellulose synthase/poly-beta-1,6-N-acetylglucosamine synthase-like glycosyltransferase
MNSKVSIVLPVYNVSTYLEECIRSLMGQDYENIEIIPVNDVGLSVRGVVKMKCHLTGLLVADMLRDLVDILHQLHRTAEGIGIYVLNQERLRLTVGKNKLDLIGLIHIAHLNGLMAHISALNSKQVTDLRELHINIQVDYVLSIYIQYIVNHCSLPSICKKRQQCSYPA